MTTYRAEYGEHQALVSIDTLAVVAGRLPPRAMGLVMEWASLHQDELKNAWTKAKGLQLPGKIEPLP